MPCFLTARSLAAVGLVVVVAVSGCGGDVTSGQATSETAISATSPATPTTTKVIDANAAFSRVETAREPFACTPLLAYTLQGAMKAELPAMRENAGKYRDLVTAWQAQLDGIEFPASAAPTVAQLKEHTTAELNTLNAMAAAPDGTSAQDMTRMANDLNLNEAAILVGLNDLSAVLGHPEHVSLVAGRKLELAYGSFIQATAPVYPMFTEALAKNDLAQAKAANGIEQDALQRYIDALGAIDWPPGHDGQVATLKKSLSDWIELDRKQVDVPSAKDIQMPDELNQVGMTANNTKATLMDDVMREALVAGALPKC